MAAPDRNRWNTKYAQGDHASEEPSRLLTELVEFLPRRGQAIDVAGGAGRHAIWLAERGLDVTLADISNVALEMARDRAAERSIPIETLDIDLEDSTFPAGPWDLILTFHFLYRPLFDRFPQVLATGGRLICVHPTTSNLERHPKPSLRFLLEDDELPTLIRGLNILHYRETWSSEGRHEAILVAEKTSPALNPPAS